MMNNDDFKFILRVFSELLYSSIQKLKDNKKIQFSVGLVDAWVESKNIQDQDLVNLKLTVSMDLFQNISEKSLFEDINKIIDRLILAENFLFHVDDYFSQARIKEMMNWNEKHPTSTGFEFLIFLFKEVLTKNPSYLNHFWYDETLSKCIISKKKENNNYYVDILFDSSFFSECLVYFKILKSPGDCVWYKRKGNAPFPLNRIYKHHLIKFTGWLYIEHDATGFIRRTGKIDDIDTRPLIPVESSQKSGIEVKGIFLRAISRYKYRDEDPYLLFRNNCEHFSTYCFYQSPRSRQVRFIIFITFALALVSPYASITVFLSLPIFEIIILRYATYQYNVINLKDAAMKWCLSWNRFPK